MISLSQMVEDAKKEQQKMKGLATFLAKFTKPESPHIQDSLDHSNQFLCFKMSNTSSITFENSLAETRTYDEEKKEESIQIFVQNKPIQVKSGESFEQIVAVIEEKYGKKLTSKGLEKIVAQMENVLGRDDEKENKRKQPLNMQKKVKAPIKNKTNFSSHSSYSSKFKSKKAAQ